MKQFSALIVALIVVSLARAQTYQGPAEKFHIYILVGQSNMSGRARVEAEDRDLPKNLFLLDGNGKWVAASHPFIQYTNVPNSADSRVMKSKGKTGLNLGLAFARRMMKANPDVAIGLIVNSQGGSRIETWDVTATGTNYKKTLQRVEPVRKSGEIRGILWHQGEGNLAMGEAYLKPLARVIGQFRKDLDAPSLPFVAGQLAPLPKQAKAISIFNKALLELPNSVPNTGVARASDLSGADIHFDSGDTRTLGTRYAEAMLKIQKSASEAD